MNKHTPGPWEDHYNSWEVSSVYDAHGRCVAECHIFDDGLLNDETQDEFEAIKDANARLIAAAPDLLLVAEIAEAFARSVMERGAEPSDENARQLQKITRAAISKAEGRP